MKAKSIKRLLLWTAFSIAVLLNWPIAWLFTLQAPISGDLRYPRLDDRAIWNLRVPNGANDDFLLSTEYEFSIGYRRERLLGGDGDPPNINYAELHNLKVIWAGYPFKGMTCHRLGDLYSYEIIGGIEIESRYIDLGDNKLRRIDMLPCTPDPLGFLLNTFAYFGALVGPFYVFPIILRSMSSIRPKKGACPECGYDLRATDGCPECGWRRSNPR